MPADPRAPRLTGALPLVDLVLRGGRITTFADPDQAPAEVESIAVAAGRVVAVGTDQQLAPYADLAAEVIDLDGRRVIPGLNDSHIHAVRGANSWSRSLHWESVRSVEGALASIAEAAEALPPGAWISVVGGWHRSQFAEGRAPDRAELDAVAPDHPVYLQELYDLGILNAAGLRATGFADAVADPPRGVLERDEDGALTGRIRGVGAFAVPIGLSLGAEAAQAQEGVRAMAAEFARHGLTGVVDGGGLLMTPRDYDPISAVWRTGDLGIRARLFVSAWTRGGEVADIDALTTLVQPDSGDGMLRIVGVGEIPHLGCHDMEGLDPFAMPDDAAEELVDIVRLCARRGWRMSVHAVLDATLGRILDAWERVEAETGLVAGRGWSIVHADEASRGNLERLARLGAGVLVQNRLILKGSDYADAWGETPTAQAPPIGTMRELGIVIGAGTDATRANWFSPWASIWWLVTGDTLDGRGRRDPAHRMDRWAAIAAYTRDAAWFTGEQGHRGRLVPGYDADLCVPTRDPLTCADEELRDIRSDLTVLGGRITHRSTTSVR
ncbi:amidohydrolase [Microbacterium sp. T2.11-28]|uniref:amidohydrolase n=1 Tax=Microbacterium sp. T2.11-28 TaxID=3041169 RepID=UPI0024778A2B|nr:amidohydrolase family protein [Microbacterium sp. T2.11-28]CAI9387304.1 N-substituted formamide deformylase [Microbacterium sp. T2.11-28]